MFKCALQTILLISVLVASSHAEIVEGIAAVVNNKVITISDLEEEISIRRQLGRDIERRTILDSMIEGEIASLEAGRLGISVTVDEVTMEILHFEETFPSKEEFKRFMDLYELNIQDLSRRFVTYISTDKVKQQKDAVSAGRYEKWLTEARKKADIKIQALGER